MNSAHEQCPKQCTESRLGWVQRVHTLTQAAHTLCVGPAVSRHTRRCVVVVSRCTLGRITRCSARAVSPRPRVSCCAQCRCPSGRITGLLRRIVAPPVSYRSRVACCVATQGRPSATIQNLYRGSPLAARPPSCHDTPNCIVTHPPTARPCARKRCSPRARAGRVMACLSRIAGPPRPYRKALLLAPACLCPCLSRYNTLYRDTRLENGQ